MEDAKKDPSLAQYDSRFERFLQFIEVAAGKRLASHGRDKLVCLFGPDVGGSHLSSLFVSVKMILCHKKMSFRIQSKSGSRDLTDQCWIEIKRTR